MRHRTHARHTTRLCQSVLGLAAALATLPAFPQAPLPVLHPAPRAGVAALPRPPATRASQGTPAVRPFAIFPRPVAVVPLRHAAVLAFLSAAPPP